MKRPSKGRTIETGIAGPTTTAHQTPTVPQHELFQIARVTSVEDLEWLVGGNPDWIFRGQGSWEWRLIPTLERKREQRPETWVEVERKILADFQEERARCDERPSLEDHLAWLGLLRHYDRDARLLDVTTRLPVAVHFGTRNGVDRVPCVWAINHMHLRVSQIRRILRDHPEVDTIRARGHDDFNALYPTVDEGYSAMLLRPRKLSRRMRLQDGFFLAGMNMKYSLEQNILGALGYRPELVFPTRDSRGVLNRPVGFHMTVRKVNTRKRLDRGHILLLRLEIPAADIRDYLEREGVSDESLGLSDPRRCNCPGCAGA